MILALALAAGELLGRIQAAPPELAAHLLWRLEEPDRARRQENLEEAWRLAGRARQTHPLALRPRETQPESVAGRRAEASLQRLDGLSLRVRVAQAMLRVAPKRAVEMAEELGGPRVPAAACRDALLAGGGEAYGLALEVAGRGYTTKERADGRPMQLLTRVLGGATAPQELLAAAQAVAAFQGSAGDRAVLDGVLAGSLERAPANWRGFVATVEALSAQVRTLDSAAVTAAWGTYLATQWGGPRCGDAAPDLAQDLPGRPKELKGREGTEKAEPGPLWEEGKAKELHERLGRLRRVERRTETWGDEVLELLHEVESWRDGPREVLFHAKASLYRELLDLGQFPALLKAVTASFVQFLHEAPEKEERPGEWLMYFRRLTAPWEPGGLEGLRLAKEEMRRTGDLVMVLLLDAGDTF